jgi:hypothetical protein
MPAGQMVYLGLRTSRATFQALSRLLTGVPGDDPGAQAVRAALDELAKAGPGDTLDAFSLPAAGLKAVRYDDPARAVEATLRMLENLRAGAAFQSGFLKDKPVVKRNAEKYGGFELSSVELDWDLEKMVEGSGPGKELPEEARKQLAAAMKSLLGERLRCWIGTDGKVLLQVTAPDWPAARALLDAYTKGGDGAGADETFRLARKELPGEATLLVLVDPVPYVGALLKIARPLIEANAPLPIRLPEAPARWKPAFAGKSLTLRPERASLDVFFSATAAHALFKAYVETLLKGAPVSEP